MSIEWRKSSRSGGGGGTSGDCVEVAALTAAQVGIRDSKSPQNPHLMVGRETLKGLLTQIKAGELDL